jgi:hypothetical protein
MAPDFKSAADVLLDDGIALAKVLSFCFFCIFELLLSDYSLLLLL